MIEISGETIKNAVVQKLLEIFPSVTVYKESKTNVVYPHFFVRQINLIDDEERKEHHQLKYSFDVRYRTVSDSSTDLKLFQNLDNVAIKLLSEFNIIKLQDEYIRCLEKNTEIQEGVLHFFFNFNICAIVKKENESPKLDKLNIEVGLKNGN